MVRAEQPSAEPAPEELLHEVISRLRPLHRLAVRAVERELAGTGITACQHALLDALHTTGPLTVPQLARVLGLDRQPVQRWVNDLAAHDLVRTAPNPAHRRSRLFHLTPKGREVIVRIKEAEATDLRRGLGDLSACEAAIALRVLDRLGEALQETLQHAASDGPAHEGRHGP